MENKLGVVSINTPRFELLYPLIIIHFISLWFQDAQANVYYIMGVLQVKAWRI